MLKILLELLQKAEQLQLDVARKEGGKITLVVRPNHKLAADYPFLSRGISIQGETAEEVESALAAAIAEFTPLYNSTLDQIAAIKSEADAAVKAAKDAAAKRTATATGTGKPVSPTAKQATPPAKPKEEKKPGPPPPPSLFGSDDTPPPPAPEETAGAENG